MSEIGNQPLVKQQDTRRIGGSDNIIFYFRLLASFALATFFS
jgi:hypothetical protein